MSEAIGIRIDEDFLQKIDKLSEEEHVDRSTLLREMIKFGYKDFLLEKVARAYMEGKITLSAAAKLAESTLWEMEKYLVDKGFKSAYSIDDLEAELKLLKK